MLDLYIFCWNGIMYNMEFLIDINICRKRCWKLIKVWLESNVLVYVLSNIWIFINKKKKLSLICFV